MEPHWNESRIKQVIGRVIRYKSHESLPLDERHVQIYRWISVFPELVGNKSADQYLIELSKKKDNIFKHFISIIKEVAIERDPEFSSLKRSIKRSVKKFKNKFKNKLKNKIKLEQYGGKNTTISRQK
jgi:predicted phage-related endonuclease